MYRAAMFVAPARRLVLDFGCGIAAHTQVRSPAGAFDEGPFVVNRARLSGLHGDAGATAGVPLPGT